MIFSKTKIVDVFIIKPKLFHDERGFFYESWNIDYFNKKVGKNFSFIQENVSFSKKNVLRGLHYQVSKPQGKLVSVFKGSILDVVIDLRKSSKTFGKHITYKLSSRNKELLWVPPGCAHGFLVLSNFAKVLYQVTDNYSPNDERCILWSDRTLMINWGIRNKPKISQKDSKGVTFLEAEKFK